MKPTPEYLSIELMPRRSGRSTDTWRVADRHGGYLGTISWHGAWHQYTFVAASGSRWSRGCLAALDQFLATVMAARRG